MIEPFTMSGLAAQLPATHLGEDVGFLSVSTDTRSLESGDLFVALRGPNFDGHEFAKHAVSAGACGLMADHRIDSPAPQLLVSDTREAFGRMASIRRDQFSFPLVAITGSNGKTTVKEMIASIFNEVGCTLATRGNLNNDIGVPTTLLCIDDEHRYAVIEMGANHPGEIAYLTGLTKPDVGVVTNAGAAHLEGFGSVSGVADAKGELFDGLSEVGTAVINADDKFSSRWLKRAGERSILTFGFNESADFRARESNMLSTADASGLYSKFSMTTPAGVKAVSLSVPGRHNISNALAAAAAAWSVGIDLDLIVAGLESLRPVPGRLNLYRSASGAILIDDTYNANPASLVAGIELLKQFSGKKILVLGDMAELGQNTRRLHREMGVRAKELGIDKLISVGELSALAVESFGSAGKTASNIDDAIVRVEKELTQNACVLIKGSRRMQLDQLVSQALIKFEFQEISNSEEKF